MTASRRTLLRGAAGAGLALPFFSSLQARAADPVVPKRLIVWFTPCGFQADGYPTSMDFSGSSFEPLQQHASDLIVTRGLAVRSGWGQEGADHPTGFGHMLTGNHCEISNDDILRAQNASVEQFAAARMGLTHRASSLHGIASQRAMSYDNDGYPIRAENDPVLAFDRLFGGFTAPDDPDTPAGGPSAALSRRKTILDSVRKSYVDLRGRLGGEDRVRIDAHVDHIRDIEARFNLPLPPQDGSCEVPTLVDATSGRDTGRLHAEILVRAMACDLTRVGTLQWYSHTAAHGQPYDWGGLGSHHAASHDDSHRAHDRIYAEELAHLLDLLKSTIAEDGQPLLHHTVVLCVSELGLNTIGHHLADLGVVIAGQAGGSFATGRYIDFLAEHRGSFTRGPDWKRQHEPANYFEDFDVPHNRLLVEIINSLSLEEFEPISTFGSTELVGGLPQIRA